MEKTHHFIVAASDDYGIVCGTDVALLSFSTSQIHMLLELIAVTSRIETEHPGNLTELCATIKMRPDQNQDLRFFSIAHAWHQEPTHPFLDTLAAFCVDGTWRELDSLPPDNLEALARVPSEGHALHVTRDGLSWSAFITDSSTALQTEIIPTDVFERIVAEENAHERCMANGHSPVQGEPLPAWLVRA